MSTKLARSRMMRALGTAANGDLIYQIFGAEPEDSEGEKKEAPETKEGEEAPAEQPKMVSLEEFETLQRRLAAADRAKGDAERRINEIDAKDKSELERAQGELQALRDKAAKAEAEALRARLSVEILKFPGFVWHDPETVLALVDMEMISVDADTNKVDGVKAALEKLAKSKPFLLKGKTDGGKEQQRTGGPTGNNPGNQTTDDKNKAREKLVSKYKL